MPVASNLTFGLVLIGDLVVGIPITHLSEVCHIEKLLPLPAGGDLIMGGFDLRSSIVPVLNFRALNGLAPADGPQSLMVVLKHDGRQIAFGIDEIMGMAQTSERRLQSLQGKSTRTKSFYRGVFTHDAHFVSVLDVAALCDLPAVYATTPVEVAEDRDLATEQISKLIFEAGGALFSVPAVDVYAAVPSQEIARSAIAAGSCLGEISYYNRRIPVMCPVRMIGLGTARTMLTSQVVILAFPDDRLLGVAVDAVLNIQNMPQNHVAALPAFLNKGAFVGQVHMDRTGRQVYALDLDAIRTSPGITAIASLSDRPPMDPARTDVSKALPPASNILHEQKKYLIVRAGRPIVIPLSEISCILEPPQNVTPAAELVTGFCGYFPRLGQSVALFDLTRMLGGAPAQDSGRRVILTGDKENQIGFWVEQVLGIEMSEWREKARSTPGAWPIVKINSKEDSSIFPLVSLKDLILSCGHEVMPENV